MLLEACLSSEALRVLPQIRVINQRNGLCHLSFLFADYVTSWYDLLWFLPFQTMLWMWEMLLELDVPAALPGWCATMQLYLFSVKAKPQLHAPRRAPPWPPCSLTRNEQLSCQSSGEGKLVLKLLAAPSSGGPRRRFVVQLKTPHCTFCRK